MGKIYRLYFEDGGAYGDFETTLGMFTELSVEKLTEIVSKTRFARTTDLDDYEENLFEREAKALLSGDKSSQVGMFCLGMEILEDGAVSYD